MLADRVVDDVVGLAIGGEVFLCLVDDPVGSKRLHDLDVLRVAYGGDIGVEVSGQLNRCGTDGPRCAVDEGCCPARSFALLKHPNALSPPSKTAAASSKFMPIGLSAISPLAGMQTNSA